ncbi:hypothetical protein THIARS_60697 [Thiomonas delicata]|uniref:Uncharacterized protein n=1 Tax=Thiomonas delicata TaxID=364030 RepID=A0A238D483_THIDL|nr:hypothetical protein THIARS_60697 [Thiomonas delicata]
MRADLGETAAEAHNRQGLAWASSPRADARTGDGLAARPERRSNRALAR